MNIMVYALPWSQLGKIEVENMKNYYKQIQERSILQYPIIACKQKVLATFKTKDDSSLSVESSPTSCSIN